MGKVSILHLITAAKNASPFDVNMAYDAGFDKIMPYTNVALEEVLGLTQDAIFSRSPSGVKREGIFIGGRDIDLAMHMLKAAQKGMFGPFTCSIFADPSGAFTTAAGMVAKAEFHLKKQFNQDLQGKTISIFGAAGPVGSCAGIIAALQGAHVQLVAHRSLDALQQKTASWNQQYQINMQAMDGSHDALKTNLLASTDIALCAAAAGIQVLSEAQLAESAALKIVADVNAVPPLGIEGVAVGDDGIQVEKSQVTGIGALAIGQLKYQIQHELLKRMLSVEQPQVFDFMSAFHLARELR
jgi:methylene-tetrahydromethanopterin dehydrogenase